MPLASSQFASVADKVKAEGVIDFFTVNAASSWFNDTHHQMWNVSGYPTIKYWSGHNDEAVSTFGNKKDKKKLENFVRDSHLAAYPTDESCAAHCREDMQCPKTHEISSRIEAMFHCKCVCKKSM